MIRKGIGKRVLAAFLSVAVTFTGITVINTPQESVAASKVVTSIDVSSTVTSSKSITEQTRNDEYAVRDVICSLSDSSVNRASSEHFQIIWGNGDTTGTVTYDFIVGNLINLENIRAFYVNELGMKDIATSQNGSLSGKYKTNVYVSNTGLDEFTDDWAYMSADYQGFAYLFVAPGAMRVDEPSWVIPHELAHVFTYHQGGTVAYAWYEALANWFRDQYLGSEYYAYGGRTYGPTSDFFLPYVTNSSYHVPHMLNWYDTWPIFLYISENPDNIDGLGMEVMRKICAYDSSNKSMYDVIEELSGVSIKTILAGMSRRMATYDYSRQEHYFARLREAAAYDSSVYSKLYTTLQKADSNGWQSPAADEAPMQTGFNIIPLDVDLSKDKISAEFVSTSSVKGADFRTSIVTSTADNTTRYSNIVEGNGTAQINLRGDETKAYLVVCATPDTIEKFEVNWDSSAEDVSTRYTYKVRVTATDGQVEETTESATNPGTISGKVVHNFQTDGLNSSFFRITGNTSGSKGSATFNGITSNVALKMESATNISFSGKGTLLLVFGGTTSAAGKSVKVDGVNQTIGSNQVLTVELDSGSHTITKGDAINLFIMIYVPSGNTGEHEHSYTSTVTTQPGCTTNGVRTYTCSCSHTYTELIAPTGHSYTAKVTKEATCGESGVKTYTCVCGDSYTERIPATNKHSYNGIVTMEPTCGYTGTMRYTCACGSTYTETIPATGNHDYEEYYTVDIPPTTTTEGEGSRHCKNCDARTDIGPIPIVDEVKNGLYYEDGQWRYYKDSVFRSGFTGLVDNDGYRWYVVNGVVATEYTGLVESDTIWYGVRAGKIDYSYTGLLLNGGAWWYVENGVLNTDYTGTLTNDGGTWYIVNGKIDTSSTGIRNDGENFWYVVNGKVNTSFVGMYNYSDAWWYVKDGKIQTDYKGMIEYSGNTWYVANGKIDITFTGLGLHNGTWYCVQAGKVNMSYTGLVANGGSWWYIIDGVLDTTTTGIVETGGSRWLVATGKLQSEYTGVYSYQGNNYTIINGKVQ